MGGGGRPESAFQGLQASSSPGSCVLYSHRGVSPIPDLRPIGPGTPIPVPGRIGKRGFPQCFPVPAESGNGPGDSLPVSQPDRESGERELGISGSEANSEAGSARNLQVRVRVPSPSPIADLLSVLRRGLLSSLDSASGLQVGGRPLRTPTALAEAAPATHAPGTSVPAGGGPA